MQSFPYDGFYAGADVFIIGGGTSLHGFDWKRLVGRKVIGANAAFTLGARICPVCFFSDAHWFDWFEARLHDEYAGIVVTHSPELRTGRPPWVHWFLRREPGLWRDAIGGCNSGAGAINLALIMGARRVFLLGFDCKPGNDGRANWHPHQIEPTSPYVYPVFMQDFAAVARDLPSVFPGTEIINLNPDSELECFRKESPETYL